MKLVVLHVTSSFDRHSIGGVSHLSNLVLEQVRLGYEVRVVSAFRSDDDTTWAERLRKHNVQVEMVGPVKGRLGRNKDIDAMIGRHMRDVNIVHLHGLFSSSVFSAARSARAAGKPYIWQPKGDLAPDSWKGKAWINRWTMSHTARKLLDGAAVIHYNSQFEAELAAPLRLKPRTIITSVGIDPDLYKNKSEAGTFRKSLQIDPASPLIVCMGDIRRDNGASILVEAIGSIKSSAVKLYLVLSGSGETDVKDELENLANANGLGGRFFLMPPLASIQRQSALQDATVTVLPWKSDSYGYNALEAIASGSPVILTNGCSLHHEALDHRFGGVCAPTKVDVTREIIRFLNSPNLRAECVQNGSTWIAESCTFAKTALIWHQIYSGVLGVALDLKDQKAAPEQAA